MIDLVGRVLLGERLDTVLGGRDTDTRTPNLSLGKKRTLVQFCKKIVKILLFHLS